MYIGAPSEAPRATRRCGAPLRHMALRPGWAQGHVTYVRFVMRNASKQNQGFGIAQTDGLSSTATRIVVVNLAALSFDDSGSIVSIE